MTRALSRATEIDEDILAYKLMGNWDPARISFNKLILEENEEDFFIQTLPVLSRLRDRRRAAGAWGCERVERRTQVGRHPVTGDHTKQ